MTAEEIQNKDLITLTTCLAGITPATGGNYGVFFIALRPYEVIEISEVHETAGSDAGAVTLNIERLSGTEAVNGGDTICVAAFNLKGTANTVVIKKTTALQNRVLAVGDRLALKDVGTLTAVAGLCVSLLLKPLGKGDYR